MPFGTLHTAIFYSADNQYFAKNVVFTLLLNSQRWESEQRVKLGIYLLRPMAAEHRVQRGLIMQTVCGYFFKLLRIK